MSDVIFKINKQLQACGNLLQAEHAKLMIGGKSEKGFHFIMFLQGKMQNLKREMAIIIAKIKQLDKEKTIDTLVKEYQNFDIPEIKNDDKNTHTNIEIYIYTLANMISKLESIKNLLPENKDDENIYTEIVNEFDESDTVEKLEDPIQALLYSKALEEEALLEIKDLGEEALQEINDLVEESKEETKE